MLRDGLGERRQILNPSGSDKVELLCLRSELTTVPSFEFALRERVSHLAQFRHACYARVRSVERLNDGSATLALVSDVTEGVRLSALLEAADRDSLLLDINAALCVVRQIAPAIALLHEAAPEISHGALSPERIIVTPTARVVVAEYVLGAALEQLRYSQERYWKDLRVATARVGGLPRFDHRSDVTALGIIALSLIIGRPLRDDEFPGRLPEVLGSAWAISGRGGFEPLPAGLRAWLARAMQLDARNSFTTAAEAQAELERMLGDSDYLAAPAALEAVLARFKAGTAGPEALAAPQPAVLPKAVNGDSRPPQAVVAAAPGAPTTSVIKASVPSTPVAAVASGASPVAASPQLTGAGVSSMATPSKPAAAAAVSTSAASSTSVAAAPVSPSAGTSTSVAAAPVSTSAVSPAPVAATPIAAAPVSSKPASAASGSSASVLPASSASAPFSSASVPSASQLTVIADSVAVPRTPPAPKPAKPETQEPVVVVSPKEPEPDIEEREDVDDEPPAARRNWTMLGAQAAVAVFVLAAGGFAARHYLAGSARQTTGTVSVTTNPAGAQLLVDGVLRGTTPATLAVAPGAHTMVVRSEGAEPRTIPITVTAGGQVSQYLDLPRTAPALGQLQIRTEPAGAQVSVDGVGRGVSPVMIADLSPGDHTVRVESDLGKVEQTVNVAAGTMSSVVVPLTAPKGAPVSGWITVSSPAELQLYENGKLLGSSETDRLMVSAGSHQIELVNESIGYHLTRTVQVSPGRVSAIKLELPKGTLALNAIPWADVWIDGEKAGETPIGNIQLPIGSHSVVFRNPDLGEQKHTVVVSLTAPARLSVDLRKK